MNSYTVKAITMCLQSDEPTLRDAALTVLSKVIRTHRGNWSEICRQLGFSRPAASRWLRMCPELVELTNAQKSNYVTQGDNWAGEQTGERGRNAAE